MGNCMVHVVTVIQVGNGSEFEKMLSGTGHSEDRGRKVQNFTFDLIINRLKERNDRNVSLEKGG